MENHPKRKSLPPFASPVAYDKPVELYLAAILDALGEDVSREGLRDTPKRYAKAMQFLTGGYGEKPREVVGRALFTEKSSGLVVVRDIEFYSLCEHHLLPFFGKATVAYLPAGKVIGLSKIPRVVNVFARRLQVQERLTREIGEAIAEVTGSPDVAVLTEASHLCMMMRGVEKQGGTTASTFFAGKFSHNAELRRELFSLAR